jgi:capsular exopolysaccharide synthesis family protein
MTNEQKVLALSSPEPAAASRAGLSRTGYYHVPVQPEDPEDSGGSLPVSHYLWVLRRHKWRLLAFVVLAVASTVIVSSRLTPYYESTATVDIDRLAPTGVIGQEATGGRVNDSDFFLATQMKLIASDSVLRPVVQSLKLPVPKDSRPDAPVSLPYLVVTRPPKTYLLQISYRSPNPALAADVANAIAKSYINHSYAIRYEASAGLSVFMTKELGELQAKMERSGAALAQFEKELNVIDPAEKTSILSARLLQLNTDYTKAQGDRFEKESVAKSVREGSLEALEASTQGEQIRKLADKLGEDTEKFEAVKVQYGTNHPAYKKAAAEHAQLQQQFDALKANIAKRVDIEYREAVNREQMLKQTLDQTKAESDSLNGKNFEYTNLKREADADRALYEELTRKIKEATINAGFQNSSIRLADLARPAVRPVFPKVRQNAILALAISLMLGIGVVFVTDNLDHTLRDPDHVQRQLQTEVLGSLPVVKAWRGQLPSPKDGSKPREFFGATKGLANTYEEAVRTLRDSILLPHAESRPHSLLITSATPREGKTTTAVHLAIVHSQQKRRTLLIDADLRRPGVYNHVGVSNDTGLSNVVNGDVEWRAALQTNPDLPHLSILPAGPPSRKAADGLGQTLRRLLAEAAQDFDLVVCDAPPLLGFAESLQIASLVDGVVVVALAGQTERTAVASVLSSLRRLHANVLGLALNEVRADMSERYYYYGYYGKYYSRYYKPLSS